MSFVNVGSVHRNPTVNGVGLEREPEKYTKNPGGSQGIDAAEFKQALLLRNQDSIRKPVEPKSEPSLKFSNHAVDRMRLRGVGFGADQLEQIERAVEKASTKGARETLVLTDEAALIVNIKNKIVVTVMDKNSLKENVFTNIDSTVVI